MHKIKKQKQNKAKQRTNTPPPKKTPNKPASNKTNKQTHDLQNATQKTNYGAPRTPLICSSLLCLGELYISKINIPYKSRLYRKTVTICTDHTSKITYTV